MRHKIISLISALLAFVMLLTVAGCGSNNNTTTVKPTNVANNTLEYIIDKSLAYAITRSAEADTETEEIVKTMRTTMRKNFNTVIKLVKDSVEYNKNAYEILVGQTNRPESIAALEELKANRANCDRDFIVKVDGFKIVILATTASALQTAVDFFVETFCKNEDTWKLLRQNYKFIYEHEFKTGELTLNGKKLSDYRFVVSNEALVVYYKEIQNFCDIYEDAKGTRITIVDDTTEPQENEIIVGPTKRSESIKDLGASQYKLEMMGSKLLIDGSDAAACAKGVKKLTEQLNKALDENTAVDLPADYSLKEAFNPDDDDYRLVWNEEFNKLDTNLWVPYLDKQGVMDKVSIRDGCVVIPAYRNADGTTKSQQISTWRTFGFLYGSIEFRAKLGVFPAANALWFFGRTDIYNGNVVEIDLLEDFTKKGNGFDANVHRYWSNISAATNKSTSYHIGTDGSVLDKLREYKQEEQLSERFHIYTFTWTPDELSFAVDGKIFWTYDAFNDPLGLGDDFLDLPMDSILMSCGLSADGSYGFKWQEGDPTYVELLVDYIRLYQKPSENGYIMYNREIVK